MSQETEAAGAVGKPSEVRAADDAGAAFVADGRERRLAPRSVDVERVTRSVGSLILAAITLAGVSIFALLAPIDPLWRALAFAAWLALCVLLAIRALWWPAVSYRYTAYRVSAEGIRIRRGVFWRSVTSVPRSRVQHTDVSQGPIERAFELATLVIYTAGTQHASVSLSGLPRDVAFAIRDHLIEGGEDDAV